MNKKHITLLAGASMLVLGFPAISMAQGTGAASGPFADVPADHWAYQSVDTLQKAGIVIGYPDGTYGGKRAMTRYEFAVAIARLLPLLKTDTSSFATKDDLAAARQDLENKLQANSDAVDALKKLVDEFQPELQKLGQDVAAVNDRLNALEARVAAVEAEQRRVKITGTLNIIAEAFDRTKGTGVDDQNGNVIDGTKHLLQQANVYHDFALGIRGRLSDTATANVILDFGNYLSAIGNTAAPGFPAGDQGFGSGFGGQFVDASNEQTTVWEANLQAPVNFGPLGGADLTAGRFGNQWTRYTLQQVDADVYTNLYQTDSGNITTDGARAILHAGPVKLNGWAGQLKAIPFSQPWGGSGTVGFSSTSGSLGNSGLGAALLPANHVAPLLQGAGVRATIGDPKNWVLGASVEQFALDTNQTGPLADAENNRQFGVLSVYGVDFNGTVPFFRSTGLTLDASWTELANGSNSSGFNNVGKGWKYQATDDQLGLVLGALSLKGGYQYVGPDFSAPGYWGRAGFWINPTNIQGPVGSLKYTFSPKLSFNAEYDGWKAAYGGENSPLQQGDKLTRYQAGFGYGLSSAYAVDLGYESDELKLADNAGKPTWSAVTIGLGHTFNQNASFKLTYQLVQFRPRQVDTNAANSDGNVAVGQFSLKF